MSGLRERHLLLPELEPDKQMTLLLRVPRSPRELSAKERASEVACRLPHGSRCPICAEVRDVDDTTVPPPWDQATCCGGT